MWIKYWVLILLALLAGILAYAHSDPTVGRKVGAVFDLLQAETNNSLARIWAILDGLIRGR